MFCHLKRRLNVQNHENTSDLNSSDLSFMEASSCTFDLFQHCCCLKDALAPCAALLTL